MPTGHPLLDAADAGDEAKIQQLLRCQTWDRKSQCDPNATGNGGRTALHFSGACPNITARLLDARANADATDVLGCTPLHIAARDDHLETVQLLLSGRGIFVHTGTVHDYMWRQNKLGDTALHLALEHSAAGVAEFLLKTSKSDIAPKRSHLQNSAGRTPLHQAIAGRGPRDLHEHAQWLMEDAPESVNKPDSKGETPLALAIQHGKPKLALKLLSTGAHLSSTNAERRSVLHTAALRGALEIVACLVEHPDIKLDSVDIVGKLPIHLAAGADHVEVVRLLLGASREHVHARDRDNASPLHIAAHAGAVATTRLLLEFGADLEAQQHDGATALGRAAGAGADTWATLLEASADVACSDSEGATPLHLALREGHPRIAEALIEHGAPVCAADKLGVTALHIASAAGLTPMCSLLIQHSAPIDCPDIILTRTPLHNAVERGDLPGVRLLLAHLNNECSAPITLADSLKQTPLALSVHHQDCCRLILATMRAWQLRPETIADHATGALLAAAKRGTPEVMELLLENSAQLTSTNDRGETALHLAAEGANLECCYFLLDSGVNLGIKNKLGETALHVANRVGDEDVIACLADASMEQQSNFHFSTSDDD